MGLFAVQALPDPARADVLVSNIDKTKSGFVGRLLSHDQAQAFTTGPHSAGYVLTGVELNMQSVGNRITYVVGVYASTSTNNAPGALVGTLANPASVVVGNNAFTTNSGLDLAANTTYFVVVDSTASVDGATSLNTAREDTEDAGGESGWSIDDTGYIRNWHLTTGGWAKSSPENALMIRVNGRVKGDQTPTFGENTIEDQSYLQHRQIEELTLPAARGGNGTLHYSLTGPSGGALPAGLNFDSATRKLTGTPTATQAAITYTYTATDSDTSTNPDSTTLTFTITVTANAVPSFGGNTIEDQSYTQNTQITELTLPAAMGGDGTLTYELVGDLPAGLNYDSATRKLTGTPTVTQSATSYTWRANDSNGDKAELTFTITVAQPNAVPTFGSSSYTFDLAENADGSTTPVSLGTVTATDADTGDTVSYRITAGNTGNKFAINSSTGALSYTGGGEDYEGFTDPTTAFSLMVRVSDGTDHTDVPVTVRVTDVDEPPGKPAPPSVAPTVGSTTSLDVRWRAPANTGPAIQHYDLRYRAGASGIWIDGPQDQTGTSAAIASLQVGTIYQVQVRATNAEDDGAWSDSGSGTTSSPTNTAPVFDSASYTFDLTENVDGSTTPVSLGTVTATDADTGDTVSYRIMTGNTGNKFAINSSTGALSYTGGGEDYEGFTDPTTAFSLMVRASDGTGHSGVLVTVRVTDVDEPPGKPEAPMTVVPTFGSSSYTFDLTENADGSTTPVSLGTATDADTGDTVSYRITVGNTGNKFAINSSTGALSYTGGGEDYEGFTDPTTAFSLMVRVSDGTGHSEVSVTVRVTDVDEPPGKPEAPSVAPTVGSTTSLDVNWRAPSNVGRPVITSYDVRYRAGSSGDWTDGPQDVTGTSASITNLTAVTSYQVQVRATNAEGDGVWSASGSGKTTIDLRPVVRAWLSRFGRTVGTHMTDVVGARLRAPAGLDSHVTVGGYRLPLKASQSSRGSALLEGLVGLLGLGPGGPGRQEETFGGWEPDPRHDPSRPVHLDLRRLLVGSSFRLHLGAGEADGASPRLTAWGRVAGTRFDGRDGALTLDGEVLTGTVGVDGTWARWLAGVAVSHSRGDGSYTQPGTPARGTSDHTLTSLHPYLRYQMTDRLDVWGLLGYGWGEVTLAPATGTTVETDTTLVMGAVGSRGVLLAAAEHKGFELATRTDLMLTRMTSEAGPGLAAQDADAHRLRLMLEGSRGLTWAEGRRLTPTVQVGLRHDWGDAETGFGLEVGSQVQYVDPALGLTVAGTVRGLLAHAASGYKEWGASGLVRLAPGSGGRGLALTLAPAWGATASGVEALWTRQSTAGLVPPDQQGQLGGRVNAEVGYGFAPFAIGVLTPYAGTVLASGAERTYRVGTRWRLMGGWATGLEVSVEGQQQEAGRARPMNQGLRFQAAWGF